MAVAGQIHGSLLVSVVVPVLDERDTLPELHRRLTQVLSTQLLDYELLFVNDGSSDGTAEWLDRLAIDDDHVRPLHLSRNFGHQAAVSAGLEQASGDAVIVLDGDLQDPPEVIPALLERWREGYDIVYAVRTKRKEHILKRAAYFCYYRLLRAIADLDIPLDTGDFCVMDRRAVEALNLMPERQRFVRGLRSYIGYKHIGVSYERDSRYAGRAKYTFGKLVGLAVEGVVSFSTFPVRALGWLATVLLACAVALGIGLAARWGLAGQQPSGWQVVAVLAVALSGLHLSAFAILGAYILKIFAEVKRRPPYILDERTAAMSPVRLLRPPASVPLQR